MWQKKFSEILHIQFNEVPTELTIYMALRRSSDVPKCNRVNRVNAIESWISF